MSKLTGIQQQDVQEYYGKVLQNKDDLKTSACCSIDSIPDYIKDILKNIEPEICERFYGCGSPIPYVLDGITVLDLGCGTGRDVYTLSKLVGESGKVIGVDMTDEQLAVARQYQDAQAKAFGYAHSNVEFHQGYIEDLKSAGIQDNSVDLVVSNCVINLSPNKHSVLSEIFRVLKPGGELYFSDVFADRRIPEELKNDQVLVGECLAGAMYVEDFRRLLHDLGCKDSRAVTTTPIELHNKEIKEKLANIKFCSRTIRAFKLDTLEDLCEDYGQVATYLGTIPESPSAFILDDHHLFEKNKPMLVCGNTASMLQETRYAKHFQITGDRSKHYGKFPCGPNDHQTNEVYQEGSCC